ncbi:MAG TPA: hypothetical protein VN081_04850 [Dongiaceae bacterium]|nr:hypothetical protein [Dongiaceae bacterium]
MSNVISLHVRRQAQARMDDINALGELEKSYVEVIDDYDHGREDLWYLRSMVQQFFYSVVKMVDEKSDVSPPMSFILWPNEHQPTPSQPDTFRIFIGTDKHQPKVEVMRFSVKYFHKDNLHSRGEGDPRAWRNPAEVFSEVALNKLPVDPNVTPLQWWTADCILWEAFCDTFIHLAGPEASKLNPHRPLRTGHLDGFTFHALGGRVVGDYMALRARRSVSDTHALVVTGFYDTRAVRDYQKAREEGKSHVRRSA